MKLPVNFTPGPSQLYYTVEDHMKKAFREGVPSLSHRSKQFEHIYRECTEGLRNLLGATGHHIFFAGSATEIWERIIENLVDVNTFHLVNGSFSKRFFEVAGQLGRTATSLEVEPGQGFSAELSAPVGTELIAVTHNETSTGVSTAPPLIGAIKKKNPNALIAVDAVSSLPYPDFDYQQIDTAFFSVQKAFGMPAGLGVWLVNDRCIAKAEELLSKGRSIGSYHSIPSLMAHATKNQTPETPNVLAIFVLNEVIKDFQRRGILTIRRETEYKAAILYQLLESHPQLRPFVKNPEWQSKTVIVAECGDRTTEVVNALAKKGMQPGDGYGPFKKSQLRFANFPTHSREQFELLVDTLAAL